MEKRYFIIIRRWLWLLILATVLAGGAAYMATKNQPTQYEANVKLLVGPGVDSPNPDLNALRAAGQLIQTYAELVDTGPFIEAVIDKLNLDMDSEKLSKRINVKYNRENQIISITIQDTDPERTKAIANAVANTLVEISPSGSSNPSKLLRDQMLTHANDLEKTISESSDVIKQLESNLRAYTTSGFFFSGPTNADIDKINSLVLQLTQERTRLSDLQSNLTSLYESLMQTSTNQVKIIENATFSTPVASRTQLYMIAAGMAGLLISLILVLAFEFLEDTVKSADELAELLRVPLLAVISARMQRSKFEARQLFVKVQPNSPVAENYRLLGTRILPLLSKIKPQPEAQEQVSAEQIIFKSRRQISTLMISNLQQGSEAGTISSNLAIILSQLGVKTILIEADLHQSRFKQMFSNTSTSGLANVLVDPTQDVSEAMFIVSPGLSVLPAGQEIPSVPGYATQFELLVSNQMIEVIKELKSKAKVVIISAPPISSFSESLILASRVDGVLLVGYENRTRRRKSLGILENLHAHGIHPIGIVVARKQPLQLWNIIITGPSKAFKEIIRFLANITQKLSGLRGPSIRQHSDYKSTPRSQKGIGRKNWRGGQKSTRNAIDNR